MKKIKSLFDIFTKKYILEDEEEIDLEKYLTLDYQWNKVQNYIKK